MPSKNRVLLSAAGSGKTSAIVQESLSAPDKRIAIVTYTRENFAELQNSFRKAAGRIPENVSIYTWYQFLLQELAWPYQNALHRKRISGLFFVSGKSTNRAPRSDVGAYYFTKDNQILSDRASDFVIRCNEATEGWVMQRLRDRFHRVYIDEVQDLAGYDLDVLEAVARTEQIDLLLYGDARQGTFSTNFNDRNRQYRGAAVANLFEQWERDGLCDIEHRNWSYRCNQAICTFADALYPHMPQTLSKNHDVTGHDGVFTVRPADVAKYVQSYSPTVLRYSVATDCHGHEAVNFGACKGRTYDRVLIFPNGKLTAYLRTGAGLDAVAKYYVAVTRARYSLAFVHSGLVTVRGVSPHEFA
jgi:DNA helicase-2/ATP-dependent DNA helicase PcrA